MRVTVDHSKCQAHGVCSLTAPEVFEFGETDGYGYVHVDVVPAEYEAATSAAMAGCPEGAISIVD
ncbi:MAG: ferredoxin [Massilia sp.]|jgi:ferredoxin|nr:ferredoxin [Massilia sp.]